MENEWDVITDFEEGDAQVLEALSEALRQDSLRYDRSLNICTEAGEVL